MKTWGDVYRAALRRGDDHGYAAYLADRRMERQKAMRKIGDPVFVTADNFGSPATIIETRESEGSPASHYKVRTDTGDEFWALDYEISELHDSRPDTLEHISKVQARMGEVIGRLEGRARVHDASKLLEPEKSAYDALMAFKSSHEMTYGSPEYAEGLKILGPALDHHYAHNSHHPQHTPNGIAGMSLLDLIEMCCDWRAAGERYKGGSMAQSLAHNRERFGISDQLFSILENTVKELGW
jgi:hypothetical protein